MLFYDSSSATGCLFVALSHILINIVFILLLIRKLKKEEEERDKFAGQVKDLFKDS
jgi:preprotein translocase subunit YajC